MAVVSKSYWGGIISQRRLLKVRFSDVQSEDPQGVMLLCERLDSVLELSVFDLRKQSIDIQLLNESKVPLRVRVLTTINNGRSLDHRIQVCKHKVVESLLKSPLCVWLALSIRGQHGFVWSHSCRCGLNYPVKWCVLQPTSHSVLMVWLVLISSVGTSHQWWSETFHQLKDALKVAKPKWREKVRLLLGLSLWGSSLCRSVRPSFIVEFHRKLTFYFKLYKPRFTHSLNIPII